MNRSAGKTRVRFESDKILKVTFMGDEIGYYYWNGRNVSLSIETESEVQESILKEILNDSNFFNPRNDSIEHTDARHDFKLFLIKAAPKLFNYAFSYEIIDLKFSSQVVYMFITEFNDGAIVEDLAIKCTYDKKDRIVGFWCGERSRMLKVVKILKNAKRRFEFVDDNGFKVILHPVTIQDYKKYRNYLFINAPELSTDEEIQDWLKNNF